MDEDKYFETIAEYKLLAKHEVGQNFLLDKKVASNIVSLLDIVEADRILEIGSGAGSLSFYLAGYHNESDLLDIDESLVLKLKGDFANTPNIHPIMGNVLKWDLEPYTKIVGNLPYYITSSIIEKILLEGRSCKKAVLMVQKEAFNRLNSHLKDKDYGPLIILLNYLCTIKKEAYVARTSFSPAPHVDSVVFSLSFKENADRDVAVRLYKLTSGLFLHRRKTILNNLSSYLKDDEKAHKALAAAHIENSTRPEEISLEGYLSLLSQLY
ncbi:MAG: 16S rRNA (adenine(1518)-N(6)/adenine(1519)-N(6))-dimethyltransferase RsmA [Bacilli bacterium]|jgi:16S rRNA (adenine1518-N6/adenine1519-N6)-dimethyltransferase|nr:16S rRNA (adenine(1518)-N(6)/adenine(1519)-N(6))-dimethyltransferase RsmA [Bacilli bacterium]MCH4210398.1 16S rRNA (adenine(1518)-N(6)/adenine(1519)-N(6))-dimethyltransferase RsmA [Bacilli bacterium]MCH4228926.1 16S rRNA (adenine(1518)-N(6)/adenine(1519)-N(6))-dimethyltransferase RsmA [Bacilli bacterium]MCH4277552.1 16S rRNA (adenine(1518)-N(6)/adenine(1519)-N(6))-dimethyltransferase RsmA [Bacilli bacterium]MCI2055054.1 16S rRNA (adenine(1518)-N(6)/adenine(1519)-N(6))-dimethyltransferase Rsm